MSNIIYETLLQIKDIVKPNIKLNIIKIINISDMCMTFLIYIKIYMIWHSSHSRVHWICIMQE